MKRLHPPGKKSGAFTRRVKTMTTHWHPGELLGTSSAYWRGCTLQAAVRLNVFTGFSDRPLSGKELAARLGSSERATILLLDALAAMGLLIKEGEHYSNNSVAQRFLVESSADYMGHIILHHHHLLDGWAQLERVIKTGKSPERRTYGQDVERRSFIMGMFNLAMQIAPQLSLQIDLKERKRLLDLGGGPGTYAIHFCKANPGLNAVIFDRPTTESFAQETVSQFDLDDRIAFLPGDFTSDPITGGPYDVAWLSHVLHSNPIDECYRIVKKCVEAMEPGGLILIHDFILDNNKDGPEFPALFSLNMLLAGNGGRSYSQEEIIDMLSSAGVGKLECHPFRAKNDSSIVYGIVK